MRFDLAITSNFELSYFQVGWPELLVSVTRTGAESLALHSPAITPRSDASRGYGHISAQLKVVGSPVGRVEPSLRASICAVSLK